MNNLRFYVVFLIVLFVSCSNRSEHKNHLAERNLSGKVKSVIMYSGEYVNPLLGSADIKNAFSMKIITQYSENGNILESLWSSNDGIYDREMYAYDSAGRNVSITFINNEGDVKYRRVFKYDENGDVIESLTLYPEGKQTSKWTFQYDSDHNQIEAKSYSSDGSFEYMYNKKYKDGLLIEEERYDTNDILINRTVFNYNDNRDEIGSIHYGKNSELDYKETFKYENYDANRNWLKRVQFRNEVPVWQYERIIEYYP